MKHKRGRPPEIEFALTASDRRKIEKLLGNAAGQTHRACQRGRLLLALGEGKGLSTAAKEVGVSIGTAQNVRRRYREEGLEQSLNDKPRPGQPPKLSEPTKQRIVAIACTDPPPGHSHWSVRLLAKEAKRRGLVDSIGRNAIHLVLQSHDLKPWREKNVVRRKAR